MLKRLLFLFLFGIQFFGTPLLVRGETASRVLSRERVASVRETDAYTDETSVAIYIKLFGHLPSNYITKREARSKGWEGGKLEPFAAGKSIGGDRFGNYEEKLPKNTTYKACDIDTKGKKRGAKRLVYSKERRVFYTADHYRSFVELVFEDEDEKEYHD